VLLLLTVELRSSSVPPVFVMPPPVLMAVLPLRVELLSVSVELNSLRMPPP
jgi:hypothetical protein